MGLPETAGPSPPPLSWEDWVGVGDSNYPQSGESASAVSYHQTPPRSTLLLSWRQGTEAIGIRAAGTEEVELCGFHSPVIHIIVLSLG